MYLEAITIRIVFRSRELGLNFLYITVEKSASEIISLMAQTKTKKEKSVDKFMH